MFLRPVYQFTAFEYPYNPRGCFDLAFMRTDFLYPWVKRFNPAIKSIE